MKFFSLDADRNRVFGLDLLRFFAIIFVVLGHSKILVPEHYDYLIGKFILDGVSIFFVLSGFLIGRILINQLIQHKTKVSDLLNFWKRRWIRTLPAYLVVLIFLVIYTYILKPNRLPNDFYKYFLFLQNFNVTQPPFFSESWSLSIEEWFYLSMPIIFILVFSIRKKYSAILFVIISIIVLVVFYRYHLFQTRDISTFTKVDLNILRQVIPRLDAIMFGVLGAYLSLIQKELWSKLNFKWIVIGAFIILYLLKQFNSSYDTFYYIVILPALKSFAVLLMLPFLSNYKLSKTNFISQSITFISLTSYSMYLVNRTIVIEIIIKYGLNNNLKGYHIFKDTWIPEYILFWVITLLLSFLMYKLIEKPFLKLRK
jgi:peptidoglycan/LPS O-acetylase OafA/YrhL